MKNFHYQLAIMFPNDPTLQLQDEQKFFDSGIVLD